MMGQGLYLSQNPGVRIILNWTGSNSVQHDDINYSAPGVYTTNAWSTTAGHFSLISPFAWRALKLKVDIAGWASQTNDAPLTVLRNGLSTALTVTVNNTGYFSSSGNILFSEGDLLYFETNNTGNTGTYVVRTITIGGVSL